MEDPPQFTMHDSEAMQKYMLLSSQQEVLRRRLSLRIPSEAPMTVTSPELRSLSSSPTSPPTQGMHSSFWSSSYSSAQPIPATPGTMHRHRHSIGYSSDDSHRLCEINQQVKATLTEMLNTESVRENDKYRAWIQERLMDTEQQIRKQRRRHSSGDREMAASIATHFSPTTHSFPSPWH